MVPNSRAVRAGGAGGLEVGREGGMDVRMSYINTWKVNMKERVEQGEREGRVKQAFADKEKGKGERIQKWEHTSRK